MRKVKLQMQLSTDGFVAGNTGELDWMEWNWDEKLKQYVGELTEPVDCIVLGRKLAEGFIPTWESHLADPATADEFSRKMVETPKVVFSKTIMQTQWKNTVVANGELSREINALKEMPGRDIIVYGGAGFVSALIAENLIDEYHLFINPVVLGSGMPIFKQVTNKLNLKLTKASPFDCGIVVMNYHAVH